MLIERLKIFIPYFAGLMNMFKLKIALCQLMQPNSSLFAIFSLSVIMPSTREDLVLSASTYHQSR